MNKLLVNDIVEKIKSEDYNFNGFGYNDYGYHISGFNMTNDKFSIWNLNTNDNNTVMEFDFTEKKIMYKSSDENAFEIANRLSIYGWKI